MKLKNSNLALILLFHLVFIRIYYWINYDVVRYICVILIGLFLAIAFISRKDIRLIKFIVVIYALSMCFSSFLINDTHVFISSLIYGVEIIELYGVFLYFAAQKRINDAINIIYKLLLFYLVINDVMMFTLPALFYESRYYLLGNKFTIGYLHLLLIVLYLQKGQMEKKGELFSRPVLIFQYAFTIFINIFTGCSTGIVGCIILLILYIIPVRVKQSLSNPIAVLTVLGISDLILIVYSNILNNSYIAYFIQNILHKDVGLHGRMTIYNNVLQVINQRLIWGYGYNQSYSVLTSQIGAVNAQNGILNIMVNFGLVGVIVLLVMIFFTFKHLKNRVELYPIIMMSYIYIILSSVEITLELNFLALLAILASCGQMCYKVNENLQ